MKTSLILIVSGLITIGFALAASVEKPVVTQTVIIDKVKPVETKSINKLRQHELSLGNRVVYVYGEIGDNSDSIAKKILYLGESSSPITILINSPGGSVVSGSEIIAAIESASGPVNTVCVELCASMAAIIHSYGTHRYMLNHSILMFHPATASVEGEVGKMNSRLTFLKRYVDKMNANIARRAGLTNQQFESLWQVEHWVDAQDATNEGFNDAIVFVRGLDALKLYPEREDGFLRIKNPTITNFQWK